VNKMDKIELEKADKSAVSEEEQNNDELNANATVEPPIVPAPVEIKIKRDWYQTESDVFVNILVKNLKKENVAVEFFADALKIRATLPDESEYDLDLNLFRSINPDSSSFKVLSSKIEVRLRKLDASSWKLLEEAKVPIEIKPSYPSSSKKNVDWGKLEKDIEKDANDEEGDVNSLFSKIYNSGDENTKKAMMKSMQESGGTVLSTNWDEIGKKKVECSPPDGMEWKQWE